MWLFDSGINNWTQINYVTTFNSTYVESALALWGHSATLVKNERNQDVMVVMFGYHKTLEYSGYVYEYDLKLKTWSRPITYGYPVNPSFGHSAVYDPNTKKMFIYGGYRLIGAKQYGLSNELYAYDPITKTFSVKR